MVFSSEMFKVAKWLLTAMLNWRNIVDRWRALAIVENETDGMFLP